jgi:hypothetical protein
MRATAVWDPAIFSPAFSTSWSYLPFASALVGWNWLCRPFPFQPHRRSFPSRHRLSLFFPRKPISFLHHLSGLAILQQHICFSTPLALAHRTPILLSASMVYHQPIILDICDSDGRSVHPSPPASLRALSHVPTTWLSCTTRLKNRQAANSVCRSTTRCCESRLLSLVHAGFPASSLASQPNPPSLSSRILQSPNTTSVSHDARSLAPSLLSIFVSCFATPFLLSDSCCPIHSLHS